MIRLDRFLSEMGEGTRSEVKAIVKKGRVTVDGAVEKSSDRKIDENTARVCLDGRQLKYAGTVYYLLHKPAGVITATHDSRNATVMDLLADAPGNGLFPVGRLDRDTEGLLLITNDGALGHRLLSPGKHVPKTYLVLTEEPVTEKMLSILAAGVDIGDDKPTLPARAEYIEGKKDGLYLTITEGRYHQVKRMLEAAGGHVRYLKRISMGPLSLEESLEKGKWRALTEEEKRMLGV